MEKIQNNLNNEQTYNNNNNQNLKIQKNQIIAKTGLEIVTRMQSVKCKFMESGLKKQEMEFYYCDCDPNKDSPICLECAKTCHENHNLSPVQKDIQICSCGMKNHFINDVKNSEYAYQKICYFNEFAHFSNNFFDFFFENSRYGKICVFCYFFCNSREKAVDYNKIQLDAAKSNFTNCKCENEKHSDINFIFEKLDFIADNDFCNEFGISPLKIFNLMFNCNKSFNNIYNNFIHTCKSIKGLTTLRTGSASNNPGYDVDKKILNTNFYRSLKNFNSWLSNVKNTYYFNKETQFYLDYDIVKSLFSRKLDANKTTFKVFSFILTYFQKVQLGNFFNSVQNYKVKDYQNMSVWQRLTIIENFKIEKGFKSNLSFNNNNNNNDNENINNKFLDTHKINNLIETLINTFTNFNSDVNNIAIGLPLILCISSIMKKFAKFSLLSEEKMIRYCKILEKALKNYYVFEMRRKSLNLNTNQRKSVLTLKETSALNESKIFKKTELSNINLAEDTRNNIASFNEGKKIIFIKNILKTLLYFAFAKNDNLILDFFNFANKSKSSGEASTTGIPYVEQCSEYLRINNKKFIFANCELGNEISRNLIDIMEIIKIEDFSALNNLANKKINEYTNSLTTLIMMKEDWYINNLQNTRALDFNSKLSLFSGVAANPEKNIFDLFQRTKSDLESKYAEYFNFKSSLSDLINAVNENVLEIINYFSINSKNIPNLEDVSMIQQEGINNPSNNNLNFNNVNKNNYNFNNNAKADLLERNNADSNSQDDLVKVAAFDTNYINSLLKLFYIIKTESKIEYEYLNEKNFTWDKISNILKILYFVTLNRPENCIMVFTNQNIYSLTNIPLAYMHKALDFLINCFDTVIEKSYHLMHVKVITKQIINLFYKVSESNLPAELQSKSIFKILKILKLLSFNFNNNDNAENRALVREELKQIFYRFPLIAEYKQELLKISEDFSHNNKFDNSTLLGEDNSYSLPINENVKINYSGNLINEESSNFNNNNINNNNFNINNEKEKLKHDFLIINNNNKYDNKQNDQSNQKNSAKHSNKIWQNESKYQLFYLFTSLLNEYFDDNAMKTTDSSLADFLNLFEIQKILKIENLGIELRTEILRFFRMLFIDVCIDDRKIIDYRYIITRNQENLEEAVKDENLKIFIFYEKLISVSEPEKNYDLEFDILIYETKVFKNVLQTNLKANNKHCYLNYFENGLIVPLKIFLNKMFSRMNKLTGMETIKIYEIVYRLLLIKQFIIETNALGELNFLKEKVAAANISHILKIGMFRASNKETVSNGNSKSKNLNNNNNNKNNEEEPEAKKAFNKKVAIKVRSSINLDKLDISELEKVKKDLRVISDKNFKIMDFNAIYQIVSNHLENFVEKPSSSGLIQHFEEGEKGENESFEYFLNLEKEKNLIIKNKNIYNNNDNNKYNKDFDEKTTFIIAYYNQSKNLHNELSLTTIIDDNHALHEVSLRSIILAYLFSVIQNNRDFHYNEILQAALIILNLLKKDTANTQKDILHLFHAENSSINLKTIIEYFFKNFISLIFSQFNPATAHLSNEYYLCCLIIKIFKFFCEEHNQEFQEILLSKLSFKIDENKKIMFYDMMLMILDKISFISFWSKSKISEADNLDHYSALFSCIVDMLIEIIQGTKKENFSLLHRQQSENAGVDLSFDNEIDFLELHEQETTGAHNNNNLNYQQAKKGFKSEKPEQNFHHDFKAAKMLRSYFDPTIESGKSLAIFLINIKPVLFNVNAENQALSKIRKLIANFILAFIEETSCPQVIKNLIISNLQSTLILKSISCALKQFYLKNSNLNNDNQKSYFLRFTLSRGESFFGTKRFTHKETNKAPVSLSNSNNNSKNDNNSEFQQAINNINNHNNNINNNNQYDFEGEGIYSKTKKPKKKKSKSLKFSERICHYFEFLYFNDEEFAQVSEFDLSVSLYTYFKLNILNKKSEECLALWNKINKISKASLEEFNLRSEDNSQLQRKQSPTKNDQSSSFEEYDFEYFYIIKFFEKICKHVNIVLPDHSSTIVVFLISPTINYLSVNSKKEFERTVNRDSRYSKLYSLILQTEYFLEEIKFNSDDSFSKILKFSNQIDYQFIGTMVFLLSLIINVSLMGVLEDGGNSYYGYDSLNIIKYVTIAIVLFNFVFIILWILSKLPLYYKIEVIKFKNKLRLEGKDGITIFDKAMLLIGNCVLRKNEINLLIWIFVCMLIGEVTKTNSFAYSIGLLSVVNLSQVFNNIFLSVTIKWKSLVWTMLFTFVIMYIFACWGFFYEQDRFQYDKVGENTCQNLFYCFLTVSNIGLRNRAGIGLILRTRSFFDNSAKFVERTFYDLLFFLLIVILMLKIIFGIILDTFRMLREKQFKTEKDLLNRCFICNVDRDNLEKNSINFEHHCEKEHFIWDYAYYIMTLRLQNAQDLNANNSYVKEQIENKSISWFPTNSISEEEEEHEEHHH